MEEYLRPVANFIDGSEDTDFERFPVINPEKEDCTKLTCSLEAVTISQADGTTPEITNTDDDIFYIENDLIEAYPAALPALSLACKVATKALQSKKYMLALEDNIKACHDTEKQAIKPMSRTDVNRIMALLDGGIKIGGEKLSPEGDFGEYNRTAAKAEARRVVLNTLLVQRAGEAALEDGASKMVKVRRIAALIAVVLLHEVGGHVVHTMVKFNYFFDPAWGVRAAISPSRSIHGKEFDDFGTMLEIIYFRGIPQVEENRDIEGNQLHFDARRFAVHCYDLNVLLYLEVESSDFQSATYEDGGLGLLGAQIAKVRRTGENFANALAQRTAAATATANANRSRSVALPAPEDYDGDQVTKLTLVYMPALCRDLHVQFNMMRVIADSTGEETHVRVGSVRGVGAPGKDGKRR